MSGDIQRHITIDPLNPPKDYHVITILSWVENGKTVMDVQSHLMKDLRNEDYVMAMLSEARNVLGKWYKEQKFLRRIDNKT